MIDGHRRSWSQSQAGELSERERRFAKKRYRRRLFASGILAVLGALIGVEPLIPRRPGWMATYTSLLLVAVVIMMMLGMQDAWASSAHYQRVQLDHLAKQAEIARQLKEARLAAEREASPSEEERLS